jgi:hypothetical protein
MSDHWSVAAPGFSSRRAPVRAAAYWKVRQARAGARFGEKTKPRHRDDAYWNVRQARAGARLGEKTKPRSVGRTTWSGVAPLVVELDDRADRPVGTEGRECR